MEKETEKTRKNIFYKTNPKGGISLIVLVITIIVVIILAAAVIISLQNNNPMVEANRARINSDVANMQAIFTNTVGKIMAEKQDVVTIVGGPLYTTTTVSKKTKGEVAYQILGTDGTVSVEGKIKFSTEKSEGTTYCTGKELPLYTSETIWRVDNQGLLSVEVGGVTYGEGAKVEEEGEEIAKSDNPMLKAGGFWDTLTDFKEKGYRAKITKVKFAVNVKVPNSKIESWDISNASDGSVMAWLESDGSDGYILTIAGKEKIIANPNSGYFFNNFTNLTEIKNLELLDTSQVTSMLRMFDDCNSLISLDLSSFNTSNVTDMRYMFEICKGLTSINFGNNFDTSNITSMDGMFNGCISLTSLDLSSFDTSNVTDMSSMFGGCMSLTSLDISNFNTGKVIDMGSMFYSCRGLTILDLSSFDTSKVTGMDSMFWYCTNLKTLNLNSFDTSSVENMRAMFMGCSKLNTTINITGINLNSYKNMFDGAATESTAQITVNYSSEMASKIDSIISQKSSNSNIVKGTQID